MDAPSQVDTGLACLVLIARFHDIAVDPEKLIHEFRNDSGRFDVSDILLSAKSLGLNAKQVSTQYDRLDRTPLPALMKTRDGRFCILAKADQDRVLIQDPSSPRPQVINRDEFEHLWSGELILFASRASIAGSLARFDFTWFIPAVVKYRRLFGEILLVSFVINLFALLTPLFFQVVMDKVLVHRGLTTLYVIAIGWLAVSVF